MHLRHLLLTFFCILLVSVAWAQNDLGSIRGQVVDEAKQPLPGINLQLLGTAYGKASDVEGNFSFDNIPTGNYRVRASGVGFITYEQDIELAEKPTMLTIRLEPDIMALDQVEITEKSVSSEIRASPLNVSLIDIEPLQNRNLDLQQALNRVAGVRVREDGGLGSNFNLAINGIGGRGVRYFIDGVPLENFCRSYQVNNLPVSLIERMEVYKGMIPVRLGADALGGAVNIVTKQYKTNYLDASYSIASFNTHRTAINTRYTHDQTGLTIGLSGYYNYSDNDYLVEGPNVFVVENGQRQPIKANRFHDAYTAYMGQIEIGFLNKPWADRLLLSGTYSGLDDEVQNGVTMEEIYGNVMEEEPNQLLALKYDKEFSSGLALNVYGVYNSLTTSILDTAARIYSWDGSFIPSFSPNNGELSNFKSAAEFTDRTFLGRINASYAINNDQKIIFNALSSTTDRSGRDPVRFTDPTRDIYQEPTSLTKMITGLSYRRSFLQDRLEANILVKHFYYASLAIPAYGEIEDLQDYQDNDYGVGGAVKYKINPTLTAKVSFERTLRLPAEDELFGDGLLNQANPALVPEKSQNLNIGLQYSEKRIGSHRLSGSLNAFYRNIEDQILQGILDLNFFIFRNVREVRGMGSEVELLYQYEDWLTFRNATTFQDLRDNQEFENDNSGIVRKNYRAILPNTPRFFSFSEITFTKKNVFDPENTLSVYYNLNYVQEFFLTWSEDGADREEFKNTIPTQWNHGAGLNYSIKEGRYNVSFEVSNLFDNLLFDNFALLKPRRAFSLKLRYSI
ncbi:MAG: TonB-dependent receptor domain-containing protein [Cyclobacteriaceae bacterium]